VGLKKRIEADEGGSSASLGRVAEWPTTWKRHNTYQAESTDMMVVCRGAGPAQTSNERGSTVMTTFKKLCVLMVLALPAIAIGGVMNLFSGFKVEREVLIDPGHNHRPLALLRAADGGYFVLENNYGNGIVKVDSVGQTQWTYREPDPGIFLGRAGTAVAFTTAASAPDGGVLIGGHRGKAAEHGVDMVAGVLIRLDKDGHVVGRVDPIQHPDQKFQLFDVYAVSRWGDGFAAIGATNHEQIIMRLRNDGSILWEKKLVMRGSAQSFAKGVRLLSNGDLAILGLDSFVRLDADGTTLQDIDIDASCTWITHAEANEDAQFFCKTNDDRPEVIPYLAKIDRLSKEDKKMTPPSFKEQVGAIGLAQVYAEADGSYILFGATSGKLQTFIPIVIGINDNQSEIAKKEFIGMNEDAIIDGIPTGLPGEYVVIRPVLRGKACTAMTFLRRH
jgi:hypothetical protein